MRTGARKAAMIQKSNNGSPFLALLVLMTLFAAVLASSGGPRNSLGETSKRADSEKRASIPVPAVGPSPAPSAKAQALTNTDAVTAGLQAFDVTGVSSTKTVFNNNDSGPGSLRQTILEASLGDSIDFAPNVKGAILLRGELVINKNLRIVGPGANVLRLDMEGGANDRVIRLASGSVSISGLTITGGRFTGAAGLDGGSGVLVGTGTNLKLSNCFITGNHGFVRHGASLENHGVLTVNTSTISDNHSDADAAGIENFGTLTMTNSTVSGNSGRAQSAGFTAGGIAVRSQSTATFLNCTIANNTGKEDPGGIAINSGGTAVFRNNIIAENSSIEGGNVNDSDIGGTVTSQGNNLIGDTTGAAGFLATDLKNFDPELGGFANNGGTTPTHSLLTGSPAINAGYNADAPATDQRGVARPQGGTVDIGAYESGVRPQAFGKIVFVSTRNGNREVYSMNSDGTTQTRLTTSSADDEHPDWKPDGTQIAFATNRHGNFEIYTMNADGSSQTRITTNSFQDSEPAWSPDGSRIAFVREDVGIFIMDANGGNQAPLPNAADGGSPSWSPDGTQIVYTCVNFGSAICRINVDGSGRTPFVFQDAIHYSPAWSPDSNSIAFSIDFDLNPSIYYLSPFDTNLLRPLNVIDASEPVAFAPAWSPDGAKLAYNNTSAPDGDLFIIDADGTHPIRLIDNGNSSLPDWFGFNTPIGANVAALYGTVLISFSGVSSQGMTTAVPIDPADAGALPGGYSLGAGLPAYEITTTASYAAPITVCIDVPAVTDPIAFFQLKLLHSENGVLVDHTTVQNFNLKRVCGSVNSLSPFVIAQGSTPTAAPASISGKVTMAAGTPIEGVVMTLSGTADRRRAITNGQGVYEFRDVATGGFFTVRPLRANYSFAPAEHSFALLGNTTDAVFTALPGSAPSENPLDTPEYFVRQQYLDVLGREPDEGGFNYWSDQILACGPDTACVNARRRAVAAAFFIEQEFQRSGSFIFDLYKGALGRRPIFAEYSADRLTIVGGVDLETEKAAFVRAFVERAEFMQKYASQTTSDSFVDALVLQVQQSSEVDLSPERNALITRYHSGGNQTESRAFVLSDVAENSLFKQAEYNAAFVLTEYFAYLRRDPDQRGYNFWLNVLNSSPENHHGMVCAFVTSAEYQRRFSSVVKHGNGECGP